MTVARDLIGKLLQVYEKIFRISRPDGSQYWQMRDIALALCCSKV